MKRLMMMLAMAMAAAIPAWAASEKVGSYTWAYTTSNGKATITAVSPTPSGDVTIPSSFNRGNVSVNSIGEAVFDGCSGLTSVTLPQKLEHIGPFAFKNCTELIFMQFPATLKYIDYRAFYNCTGMSAVLFGTSSAMNALDVEDDAFEGCESLTRVAINYPDLSKWCASRFATARSNPLYYAEALYCNGGVRQTEELTIPEGVTAIGDKAFVYCDTTNVVIPASVETIGEASFGGCWNLKEVGFSAGSRLTSIGDFAFSNCEELNGMPIPPGVTSIGEGAFNGCDSLAWVDIPDSVTSIEDDAFYGCSSLHYVFVDFDDTARVKAMLEDSGCDTSGITFQEYNLSYVRVGFDATGGKRSDGATSWSYDAKYGKPIGTLATPTWAGHEFLGWFTAKTGGTKISESTVLLEDSTFYAQWKLKQYKLTYNANGGTVSPAYKMVDYCKTYGDLPTPTWGGHDFQGWFTAKTGGTKVTSSTKCTGNATIYAQWKIKQYKLTFNANGGTSSPEYAMVDYCKTCDTFPTPTWGGHTFNGWFTARTGGTKVTAPWKCTGNKTIYAQWTVKQYTITFNANGGSVSPASKKVNYCATYTLPTPTWSGHSFQGWYTAKTGGTKVTSPAKCTGNATLYARWK